MKYLIIALMALQFSNPAFSRKLTPYKESVKSVTKAEKMQALKKCARSVSFIYYQQKLDKYERVLGTSLNTESCKTINQTINSLMTDHSMSADEIVIRFTYERILDLDTHNRMCFKNHMMNSRLQKQCFSSLFEKAVDIRVFLSSKAQNDKYNTLIETLDSFILEVQNIQDSLALLDDNSLLSEYKNQKLDGLQDSIKKIFVQLSQTDLLISQ